MTLIMSGYRCQQPVEKLRSGVLDLRAAYDNRIRFFLDAVSSEYLWTVQNAKRQSFELQSSWQMCRLQEKQFHQTKPNAARSDGWTHRCVLTSWQPLLFAVHGYTVHRNDDRTTRNGNRDNQHCSTEQTITPPAAAL